VQCPPIVLSTCRVVNDIFDYTQIRRVYPLNVKMLESRHHHRGSVLSMRQILTCARDLRYFLAQIEFLPGVNTGSSSPVNIKILVVVYFYTYWWSAQF
jgi:hypothetical protein